MVTSNHFVYYTRFGIIQLNQPFIHIFRLQALFGVCVGSLFDIQRLVRSGWFAHRWYASGLSWHTRRWRYGCNTHESLNADWARVAGHASCWLFSMYLFVSYFFPWKGLPLGDVLWEKGKKTNGGRRLDALVTFWGCSVSLCISDSPNRFTCRGPLLGKERPG